MTALSPMPPVLPTRSKGLSMLATFITILVVLATLLTLFINSVYTGFFTNARPRGDQAMGLAIPLIGLAGTILLITFAALVACFRIPHAAVGAISSSSIFSGFLVVAITFGTALASGMAFMLWCEPLFKDETPKLLVLSVGFIAGIGAPILLSVMLICGVWMSRSSALSALATSGGNGLGLKLGFFTLCVLAFAGYASACTMLYQSHRHAAANRAAAIANAIAEKAELDAIEAMPPAERLTEELSAFSDTAPLWTIISYLPDVPAVKPLDAECRAIVVARALQVPDFDNELHSCMTSDQYFYRQAAADFLTAVPQDTLIANQSAWATSLIAGLRATGAGIADRPDWPTETFDNNPSPIAHVRALLLAVDRFKASSHYPQMQQLFAQMADDSAVLNPSPDREQLLNLLANAGFRPRVQIRN